MNEWIEVKYRLPEIKRNEGKAHAEVLGWDGKRVWYLMFRYKMNWDFDKPHAHIKQKHMFHTYCPECNCAHIKTKNITHWMSIPDTPKNKNIKKRSKQCQEIQQYQQ